MPRISAFSRFGNFAFSSRPPRAEQIYRALVANWGDAFDFTKGGVMEALVYAKAMARGSAAETVRRADNQKFPMKATELIPELEEDFRIVPPYLATLHQRRLAIAKAKRHHPGGTYPNINAALQDEIGADYLALLAFSVAQAGTPYESGASFVRSDVTVRLCTNRRAIAVTGIPVTFEYVPRDGLGPLVAGDEVVIQPELLGQEEAVTLTEVHEGASLSMNPSLWATATFTKAHDEGCFMRVGRWPNRSWVKRMLLVVLTYDASLDATTRAAVHRLMQRYATGVTDWAIVAEDPLNPGQTIPYAVGKPIGITTTNSFRTF